MKKTVSLLILVVTSFITPSANADHWLCTEASSQRSGDTIRSCGIGIGNDENSARLNAFDNSKTEFNRICSTSDDCKGHNITVQPERTACEKSGQRVKCYRLIVFTIGESTKSKSKDSNLSDVKSQDVPDSFTPFVYEQTLQYPKLSKGMTKKTLLAAFGSPKSVSNLGERLMMFYSGKMCLYESSTSSCHVIVEKGKVTEWDDFKPIYTEDLK